jgi:hypothetical protein
LILASRASLILVLVAVAFSPAAIAHGEADWMHGMLDGAVLFFTSLQFLLPVLMLAFLARHHGLRAVTIEASAPGIGLLVVLLSFPIPGDPTTVGLYARGYLIALGLLVLLNLRLSGGLVLVLGLITGAMIGLEAKAVVVGDSATGLAPVLGFVCSAIGSYLPAALIAGRYTGGWQRIAVRVAASWIAAIAAIDIAFMIVQSG